MVGLRRALEIFQVAAGASRVRTGQGVVAVHVALGALIGCMCAGQRKAGGRVTYTPLFRSRRAVALLAGLRESGLHMVGLRRALEIFQVAAGASRVRTGQ